MQAKYSYPEVVSYYFNIWTRLVVENLTDETKNLLQDLFVALRYCK